MLIIDQDEQRLLNLQNIEYIEIAADNKTIRCQIREENIFLGTYASKERAKEVLREIYFTFGINKTMELFANIGNMSQANKNNMTYTPVYQMPKE